MTLLGASDNTSNALPAYLADMPLLQRLAANLLTSSTLDAIHALFSPSCSSIHHAKFQAAVLQVAAMLAAAAAAAVLALGPGCLPSQAVTSEQLLFLEAWRAVDRAYVDKSFNGQNWFKVRQLQLAVATDLRKEHS
jgi:hypothetical protein